MVRTRCDTMKLKSYECNFHVDKTSAISLYCKIHYLQFKQNLIINIDINKGSVFYIHSICIPWNMFSYSSAESDGHPPRSVEPSNLLQTENVPIFWLYFHNIHFKINPSSTSRSRSDIFCWVFTTQVL